jgi:ethanolamine ammonia-lyase small subunit
MSDNLPTPPPNDGPLADMPEFLRALRGRTPARVLVGRAGPSYLTRTQLELRRDHAAALDAVHAELDPEQDFGREFVERWGLFVVSTRARGKTEFLLRPDLGRRLDEKGAAEVVQRCPSGADLQIVIGDGLSAAAVAAQVPRLLPLVVEGALGHGWTVGQPFVVRHCRVGVLNDVGDLLRPVVAVLLIGERPGLATAESLSAYLAYRPQPGHSDAQRNLLSNIHARGIPPEEAGRRIVNLVEQLRRLQASGVTVKEVG